MKIIGVIAEFNPFHNGHEYLIQQIRQQYQADIIVCVMSGHFLQRGEPALLDKWTRAKIACLNDIDIIIELPYIASVQPAEIFAKRAIQLLNHWQITHLAFGCEDATLTELLAYSHLIEHSQQQIYQHIKQGDNYAQATKKVLPQITLSPNNILALAYLKAINAINQHIQPIAIQRLASHYHDTKPQHHSIASATAIRHLLQNQQAINNYIPNHSYPEINPTDYHFLDDYWLPLKTILARMTLKDLSQIYDMREGLEHRFLKYWPQATSLSHFISLVATKRYSKARIQRCCCHILTNTTQQLIHQSSYQHFQILALSKNGRQYFKQLKDNFSNIYFYTNINQQHATHVSHDIRVTQLYDITKQQQLNDLTQQPFIRKN